MHVSRNMAFVRNIVIVVVAIAFWNRFFRQSTIDDKEKLRHSYDYIIVGGGSAGGVLSDRLTEDGQNTVLLLEAGGDDQSPIGQQVHVPINYVPNFKTEADWEYYTEPQKNGCFAMKDRRSYWPRGKLLGGSSSINAMMWVRGSRYDYDHWAQNGAEGWSYAEVLPYFIRMEDSRAKNVDPDYHGFHGPVKVTDAEETPKLTEALLQAVQDIGESITDINGKEQKGWSCSQRSAYKGERQSTARTYIKRARNRSNLHILTQAHVTKVIFQGKKAVGVEYVHEGRLKKIYSNKEVILSAGAIGSPQILMLSGIGPEDHLEELNIPGVMDLPVGENLLDHLFVDIPFLVDGKIAITPAEVLSWKSSLEYDFLGKGIKGTTGVQGVGFQLSKAQPKDDPRPYLQYIMFATLLGADAENFELFGDKFGYDSQIFEEFNGGQQNKHGLVMLPKLLHPRSVGSIRLKSQNPFDYPLIDPQYLEDDQDVEVLLDGIKRLERMEKTEGFKSIGARFWDRHHPGCKDYEYRSDDYWRCYIRHNTLTVYHPTTTCKMGSKDDPSTVVDSKLRVHGIDGLRVVDASVMPDITSGNTNAPTIMIAEKASDIILGKEPLKPIKDL